MIFKSLGIHKMADTFGGKYPRLQVDELLGVKKLWSKDGSDIIKVCEGVHEKLNSFSKRLDEIEQKLASGNVGGSSVTSKEVGLLSARLAEFERLLESDDLRGPSGPQGPAGPPGPRGPRVDKLQDLKDICLDGVCDGCVLVRRGDKFYPEKLETE